MDALFFHPKLVHLPIALAVLMPLIAAGVWVAWWRGALPRRSWLLVVALQAILFGSSLLALRTGEAEEDRVERVVPERALHAHEEAAEVFVWGSGLVLAVMLLVPVLPGAGAGLGLGAAAVLGTVVVLGLGYRTGQAGGELVYRYGAAQAYVAQGAAAGARGTGGRVLGSRDDD